ncbi:hypothetical protein CAI16_05940 [Virgibacillus dokdonensis]|uniref:Uncharacterized protein n=1 Tax=Virgibacillus dokdonensis TaxID=302167 RepID=A0A3E0WVF3_9BACI|nr:hypothetical protein [Virgibacillus dokdonensis]RFA35976.1 hypothetical protein CAI16_05940 [Virgibacillus dokdonensis]
MSKFEENVMKLLGEINSRLDKMDEKFAGIDSRFDKMDEKFVEMNDRFEKLETDLEEIKGENQFIKRAVLDNNELIKTVSEDQKSTYELLGEHDVSIRKFRRKFSLIEEHEL